MLLTGTAANDHLTGTVMIDKIFGQNHTDLSAVAAGQHLIGGAAFGHAAGAVRFDAAPHLLPGAAKGDGTADCEILPDQTGALAGRGLILPGCRATVDPLRRRDICGVVARRRAWRVRIVQCSKCCRGAVKGLRLTELNPCKRSTRPGPWS